jgi:carboxyl-terminal processing protease
MHSNVKVALLAVAGVAAAVLLMAAGFLLGINPNIGGTVRTSGTYELQQEVLDKLENTYYKDVDPASLQGDAIDGMLAGLDDPYTIYMDPEEYADFLEDTSGSYKGVGMTVEMKDHLVTVVSIWTRW